MDAKTQPAEKASETKEVQQNWGMTSAAFYAGLRNKVVQIVTLDGKAYSGELLGCNRYDLILKQTSSGTVMLFNKGGIKLVSAVTSGPAPAEK